MLQFVVAAAMLTLCITVVQMQKAIKELQKELVDLESLAAEGIQGAQLHAGSQSRRLNFFSVGTSASSGCWALTKGTTAGLDLSTNSACASSTCPDCYMILDPADTGSTGTTTLTLSNCASAYWGKNGAKKQSSATGSTPTVWMYTFINAAKFDSLVIMDNSVGATPVQSARTIGPGMSLNAYCDTYFPNGAAGTNTGRLLFPAGDFGQAPISTTASLSVGSATSYLLVSSTGLASLKGGGALSIDSSGSLTVGSATLYTKIAGTGDLTVVGAGASFGDSSKFSITSGGALSTSGGVQMGVTANYLSVNPAGTLVSLAGTASLVIGAAGKLSVGSTSSYAYIDGTGYLSLTGTTSYASFGGNALSISSSGGLSTSGGMLVGGVTNSLSVNTAGTLTLAGSASLVVGAAGKVSVGSATAFTYIDGTGYLSVTGSHAFFAGSALSISSAGNLVTTGALSAATLATTGTASVAGILSVGGAVIAAVGGSFSAGALSITPANGNLVTSGYVSVLTALSVGSTTSVGYMNINNLGVVTLSGTASVTIASGTLSIGSSPVYAQLSSAGLSVQSATAYTYATAGTVATLGVFSSSASTKVLSIGTSTDIVNFFASGGVQIGSALTGQKLSVFGDLIQKDAAQAAVPSGAAAATISSFFTGTGNVVLEGVTYAWSPIQIGVGGV